MGQPGRSIIQKDLLADKLTADLADGDDVAGVAVLVGVECLDEVGELGRDAVDAALDPVDGVLQRENVDVIDVRVARRRVHSDVVFGAGKALRKRCFGDVALYPVKEVVRVDIDHVDRIAGGAFNGFPAKIG